MQSSDDSAANSGAVTTEALLKHAWVVCYEDRQTSIAVGEQLAALGGADPEAAAWGWWHVALAAARMNAWERSMSALAQARQAFSALNHAVGRALCVEVEGMTCRRRNDLEAAKRLVAQRDAEGDPGFDALQRFLVHTCRANLCRATGQADDALRHYLLAQAEAEASQNVGATFTALVNVGGYQQELHNVQDARQVCEQALDMARQCTSLRNLGALQHNLVTVYHALGEPKLAHETAVELAALVRQDTTDQFFSNAKGAALGYLAVGLLDEAETLLQMGLQHQPPDVDNPVFRTWVTMRCALQRGRADQAHAIGQAQLTEIVERGVNCVPYDLMQLHHALSEACEALGDASAALAGLRHACQIYEELVGRSARARRVVLEVEWALARTQRERDVAMQMQQRSEADRLRLADLNHALRNQIDANEELQRHLREQALHDPLTGLHNRRYLFEAGPALLELSRRRVSPLCVAVLDLDHFKQFNDTLGHLAGDRLLQAFAQRARNLLRKTDLICRYGGEEFVVVMPDIHAESAQATLMRLLQACQTDPLGPSPPGRGCITFSAGVAQFPEHADTLERLIHHADLALYAAKRLGRARIEITPGAASG